MKRLVLLAFVIVLCMSGCAWFQTHEDKTAQELASDGLDSFQKGRFNDAIQNFEQLKDWYPFSKFAILAELKIADAHYQLRNYEEAVFAYDEFEKLHPQNEAAPYALFRIGLCHYNQLDTPDRDQTSAEKAMDAFKRLRRQFPRSNYAARAVRYIRQCQHSLAMAEFGIGVHYFKSKHYQGALARFQSVLQNYPDTGVHHMALDYLARCQRKLDKG